MLEQGAKDALMKQLDECLMNAAKEYMEPRDSKGRPFVNNIYYLQGLTEVHIYLKTVHEFTPREVNDLLQFKDPLRVAAYCWEENPDPYCLRISDLIESEGLRSHFALREEPMQEEKPSLREQLRNAKKEISKQHQPQQSVRREKEAR